MKKMNQQIILKIIHDRQAISRAEIAEMTDLSPATVTNIVRELMNMDLVKETKRGESRGGRKPVLLELKGEGAYVIGLEWGIIKIKAVLMNLNNEVLTRREIAVEDQRPSFFVDKSQELIEGFRKTPGVSHKLMGVGIGVHGIVDPGQGESLYAPHFDWRELDIAGQFEGRLELPLIIDNDVRMMAMAEKWTGKSDFIYINTGPGIGAAIVLNDSLYYGKDWSAGEFGHMKIVEDGPRCSCGNHGCLEALISLNNLLVEYNPSLTSRLSYRELKTEWRRLIDSADRGQERALTILKKAATYLGIGIANLLNLLNPRSIIIGGEFVEARKLMFPVLKKEVAQKSLTIPGRDIEIKAAQFADDSGARGAATMVLQQEIF